MNWKFWTWHRHRCFTKYDETGYWGECIICHKRFGFVSREVMRAYCDAEFKARGIPT